MIVPPTILFAVFGDPEKNQEQWTRKRIIYIDDDGTPFVVGNETYRGYTDKVVRSGDRRLRAATSYSDFLHIGDPGRWDEYERTVIPASPGWRCLFGWRDDDEWGTWISHVAAWEVDGLAGLIPIVLSNESMREFQPTSQFECTNAGLVKIYEPGEPIPEGDDLKKLVENVIKIRTTKPIP